MSEFDNLIKAFDRARQKSEIRSIFTARLGRGDGTLVTDRPGYVWARIFLPSGVSTQIIKAHEVTIAYGAIVDVKRDTDGFFAAFRANTTAGGQEYWGNLGSGNVPRHGSSHGLYGPDPIFIESPQLEPLAITPTIPSGQSVQVHRGMYFDADSVLQAFPGEVVDLSTDIAALSAGHQQLIVIGLDVSDGTMSTAAGLSSSDMTNVANVPFTTAEALAITVGSTVQRLGAVRIYSGQTAIQRIDLPKKLDLRLWGGRTLVAADIPNLPASKITSGQLAAEQGGLGADASAFSGILKMASGTASVATPDTDYMRWVSPPSSASDTGTPGQVAYESGFFYVCVDVDEWERVALSTW